ATGNEERIARRDGRRCVARFESFRDSGPTRETVVRPDRAYLVTGGLGWIGRAVAEWLAEADAGLIVLNARRAPDEEASAWIRALRERGSRVEVMLGDVADAADVERVLEGIDAHGLALGGIFHAAGILWNGPIDGITREHHRSLQSSKVQGTWNL
ncbi:MAG: SDR family NAD(P)-dependent oxidoreductase, partial [Acidobacteria bacterium]|nr:SDR family NAD(P)-dependent oxidoreductase [Acidobacteriota bacterium]NIQ86864.1 SDR family NAD(P)-dependent oxidoreductase [Acidobacteriota bacterium]